MKNKILLLVLTLCSTTAFAESITCNNLISTANAIKEVKAISGNAINFKAAEMPLTIEKDKAVFKAVVVTYHLDATGMMDAPDVHADVASLVLVDPVSCAVKDLSGAMLHSEKNSSQSSIIK